MVTGYLLCDRLLCMLQKRKRFRWGYFKGHFHLFIREYVCCATCQLLRCFDGGFFFLPTSGPNYPGAPRSTWICDTQTNAGGRFRKPRPLEEKNSATALVSWVFLDKSRQNAKNCGSKNFSITIDYYYFLFLLRLSKNFALTLRILLDPTEWKMK